MNPRQDVTASAQHVVDTRAALSSAKQDLVDAQNALKSAQAEASSSSTSAPPSTASTTTTTLVPVATADAVKKLQTANSLPATGFVDRATAVALSDAMASKGGAIAASSLAHTAAVQSTLKLAGFWTGPVDGHWTPELTDALKAFQTHLGVPATGAVDAATLAAIESTIANAQSAASTTTTSSATSTTPTPGP